MALDPKLLDSLPNTLVDMYGVVEIDILSDMARRISTYDYFIPAAQHQMQKLQELGMVQEEIIARLAALTGQTQAEIVDLLTEASTEAVEDDVEYYTRADVYEPSKVNTEALHAQLNAGLLATQQAFKNITRTTANSGGMQFIEALDRAWTQINTGGFDYTTAIRNAIIDLAEQGLNATNSRKELVKGAIKYNKSGRVDTLEVAVRRAVVTGANQTAMKTREVLADELEVDLVETTAHGGARPEHAKWQGKVFSRKGEVTIDGVTYEDLKKATGYGTAGGLGGVNCRHSFHPYVPGAPRAYSDKMLKDYEAKNIEYNGEKYTEYEASQIQRSIEREIRAAKRKVAALEAVGEDASAERATLRKAQKLYTDFTEQTGMRKQSARTQIATAKAEREVRKANKAADVKTATEKGIKKQRETTQNAENKRNNLANSPVERNTQSGIINNVESPIEQRHTEKGNPRAISHFDVSLNKRQQKILDKLPEYDSRITVPKKSVNMKDLSALTAKTGVEYAMFTKGNERLIIRGGTVNVNIGEKEAAELQKAGFKWSGHTHPGDAAVLQASAGDYKILAMFGQVSSVIYNSLGDHYVFWGD